MLLFSLIACEKEFSDKSEFKEIVHSSKLFKKNKEIFKPQSFWKHQLRKIYWNELAYFFAKGGKYCLLMRVLDNEEEAIAITRSSVKGDCLKFLDEPIYKVTKLKATKVDFPKDRSLYLSFMKDGEFFEHEYTFLSSTKALSGVGIYHDQIWSEAELFEGPCASFDKSCNEIGINYCEFCPYGVIGTFEKESCANQKLYCRQNIACGKSEQLACQRLKETSSKCIENESQYFCQENLNYKCIDERVMCF